MDAEVLESNDWKKYRPEVVIAEDLDFEWRDVGKSKVTKKLLDLGYEIAGKTPYSLVFKDKNC